MLGNVKLIAHLLRLRRLKNRSAARAARAEILGQPVRSRKCPEGPKCWENAFWRLHGDFMDNDRERLVQLAGC